MTLALLLLACSNQITLTPSQDGCTDYDFDDPGAAEILWESTGEGSARVWRINGMMDQTGLLFEPTITFEGKVVEVHEVWTGGQTEEPFCYEPSLAIDGIASEVQVRWYLEGEDSVPLDTVNVEAP